MSEEIMQEALKFARDMHVCHLATCKDKIPWNRPMEVAKVDDDFTVWFSTFASSNKASQIQKNQNVCVTFYQDKKDIRLFGKAEIVQDAEKKSQLWKDEWQMHYKGGKEDPEYIILKINPEKIEYRDFEKYGLETKIALEKAPVKKTRARCKKCEG